MGIAWFFRFSTQVFDQSQSFSIVGERTILRLIPRIYLVRGGQLAYNVVVDRHLLECQMTTRKDFGEKIHISTHIKICGFVGMEGNIIDSLKQKYSE